MKDINLKNQSAANPQLLQYYLNQKQMIENQIQQIEKQSIQDKMNIQKPLISQNPYTYVKQEDMSDQETSSEQLKVNQPYILQEMSTQETLPDYPQKDFNAHLYDLIDGQRELLKKYLLQQQQLGEQQLQTERQNVQLQLQLNQKRLMSNSQIRKQRLFNNQEQLIMQQMEQKIKYENQSQTLENLINQSLNNLQLLKIKVQQQQQQENRQYLMYQDMQLPQQLNSIQNIEEKKQQFIQMNQININNTDVIKSNDLNTFIKTENSQQNISNLQNKLPNKNKKIFKITRNANSNHKGQEQKKREQQKNTKQQPKKNYYQIYKNQLLQEVQQQVEKLTKNIPIAEIEKTNAE